MDLEAFQMFSKEELEEWYMGAKLSAHNQVSTRNEEWKNNERICTNQPGCVDTVRF